MNRPIHAMVLEDNFALGLELTKKLENQGVRVIGPYQSVEMGIEAIRFEVFDFAILDIHLGAGITCAPVARQLEAAGIPFLFISGASSIRRVLEEFDHIPLLTKPFEVEDALALAAQLMECRARRDAGLRAAG